MDRARAVALSAALIFAAFTRAHAAYLGGGLGGRITVCAARASIEAGRKKQGKRRYVRKNSLDRKRRT